ncbi:MAG: hypothetical protein HZB56_19700 [Deltaproteobacteria bacterium]|nr:hypothetical protein [Deltaproteobacteria bacterium]
MAAPAPRSAPSAFGHAALLLALASALAVIGAALVIFLVARAESLTAAAALLDGVVFANGVVATLVATSPFLATLLVGYAYMQRGLKKRAARRAEGAGSLRG